MDSQLCSDRNVKFIDKDRNFKTRNGSINECLLLTDGVPKQHSESEHNQRHQVTDAAEVP